MENFFRFEKIDETNMDIILDELNDFLQIYFFKGNIINDSSIETLFDLEEEDLPFLKAFHFLNSDKVKKVVENLPHLVRNLAHSTQKETEIIRGNIRGRIDWSSTIKERYSQGFNDKSLFVCTPPLKYYDLEENQLLKFLLKKIIVLYRDYFNFISVDNFDIEKIGDREDWYTIVHDNFQMAKLTLRKVYFNNISDAKITSKHLRKCMKSRNQLYHHVAEAYVLYENLFKLENHEILKNLIEKTIIKTTNPHKLYEIYVFFKLISRLPIKKYKLLFENNNYSVISQKSGLKIKIYYQHTPDNLDSISEYNKILNNYEIAFKRRAPDIIIEFQKDNKTYYRIIEVKNSKKPKYVRDSVYKVMGYYKDFERIFTLENFSFTKEYPVVLVVSGGILFKDNFNPFENNNIIILNQSDFIENLDKLLMI